MNEGEKIMNDISYCDNCGFELLGDEELESGICDLCLEDSARKLNEGKHPDE